MDIEKLKVLFTYDEKTGKLYHNHRPLEFFKTEHAFKSWNSRCAGKEAGTLAKSGYVQINLSGKFSYAHRVAWALFYGNNPTEIDHINGDRSDNRINNLRECTRQQNNANKHFSSGLVNFKGVYYNKSSKKFMSRIKINRKTIYLGYFDTPEEAHAAYCTAADKYFGEFANYGATA